MRGNPILRALIALCVLLLLGWPLHHLLQADEAVGPAPVQKVEERRPVHLQVSFTEPPATMTVKSLGEVVWTAEKPGAEVEQDLRVAYPKEGIELEFDLDWPEGAKKAAKVTLTDPDSAEHTGYVWGSGKTTEVLTFQ